MSLQIINVLRREGFLDDEHIAYRPEEFPEFTLDEFREFTDSIFNNEGGGWDNVNKFAEPDAYFETYNIPFERDGEKFWLSVMYGQGSAWMLMNEKHFKECQERRANIVYEDDDEDDDEELEPHTHDIGGEG